MTKEQRPRLLASTGGTSAGPPIPTARWGIGTAGITVQGPPVPSPASLIHTGIVPECVCSVVSCVQLFVTLWTAAHQAPLPMGVSRREYWRGLPFPPPVFPESPSYPPVSLLHTQFHLRVCILGIYVSYLTMNSQDRAESITSKTIGKHILNRMDNPGLDRMSHSSDEFKQDRPNSPEMNSSDHRAQYLIWKNDCREGMQHRSRIPRPSFVS